MVVLEEAEDGVAVDADFVYWTNRGDGTVQRLAKGAAADTAPTVIADASDSDNRFAHLTRASGNFHLLPESRRVA